MLIPARCPGDLVEGARHGLPFLGGHRQMLALLDQRARHRMLELAGRQDQLLGLAQAVLIQGIDRLEPDDHRQAGPRVGREVEEGRIVQLGGAAGRTHQLDPLRLLAGAGPAQQQGDAGQAVVVARQEVRAQNAAVGGPRRLGERDLGRRIRDRLDLQACRRSPGAVIVSSPERSMVKVASALSSPIAPKVCRSWSRARAKPVGRAPEMMELREHLAAGRHGDDDRDRDRFGAGRGRGQLQPDAAVARCRSAA